MSEYEWRQQCPKFDGSNTGYKSWRSEVEDWLLMMTLGKQEEKMLGVQIRLSLSGKARGLTECIKREDLRKKDGHLTILKKLDEVYLQDNLTEEYGLLTKFLDIQRKPEESMRDYINRYEQYEADLSRMKGEINIGSKVLAVHLLHHARVTENQKQMVLAGCGKGEINYKTMVQVLKRVFEGMEKKEESEWLGTEKYNNTGMLKKREGVYNVEGNEDSKAEEYRYMHNQRGKENYRSRGRGYRSCGRGGRNPLDARGRVSVCAVCESEWHWARECPQRFDNRKRETNRERTGDETIVYVEYEDEREDKQWKEIEAILDTGCKSTVCGEF